MRNSLNSNVWWFVLLALLMPAWQQLVAQEPDQPPVEESVQPPSSEGDEIPTPADDAPVQDTAMEAAEAFMENQMSAEELAEAVRMGKRLESVLKLLRSLRPDEALAEMDRIEFPPVLADMIRGWIAHQKGDYREALRHFEKVDRATLNDPYFQNRLDELKKTAEALQHFEVVETDNFSIRYQLGKDKVMMYFLPDLLERIYATYAQLFQYERDEKIIVELMPDHTLFSYASSLTKKQIQTTGTIALCVENRLVVLTPRRVLQGYYWPDTIAHEFVHYVLTKQSRDNMPLWMQEGMAKYFEGRWDDPNADPLGAALETSLAVVLEQDLPLLTVDQMMPSFAALPTAQLARQAYAQTASMIDFLAEEKGEAALRRITRSLGEYDDMDRALQDHFGVDFDTFESQWQAWMKTQDYRRFDNVGDMSVSLLDEDSSSEKIHDMDVDDHLYQKHVRLGDLLLERNRYQAALKQYEKMPRRDGQLPRQAVLRMLACYEPLGQAQPILDLIETEIPMYQDDVTMLVYRARAFLQLDQVVQARNALERALRINPFYDDIFVLLASIQEDAGESEAMARSREILKILANPEVLTKSDSKS